jgi:arginyl-tRNA synthetase
MLVAKLANALAGLVDSVSEYAALIKPAANPCAWRLSGQLRLMALAKILRQNAGEVAQMIVSRLDLAGICDPPEVAGPGFINLRLNLSWLAGTVERNGPGRPLRR